MQPSQQEKPLQRQEVILRRASDEHHARWRKRPLKCRPVTIVTEVKLARFQQRLMSAGVRDRYRRLASGRLSRPMQQNDKAPERNGVPHTRPVPREPARIMPRALLQSLCASERGAHATFFDLRSGLSNCYHTIDLDVEREKTTFKDWHDDDDDTGLATCPPPWRRRKTMA